MPLKILDSPYREITRPILEYVKSIRRRSPRDVVTVFLPEYVVGHWWEHLLHNQSALRLKTRLLFVPGVMVTSVPWQLASSDRLKGRPERGRAGSIRRPYAPSRTPTRRIHVPPVESSDLIELEIGAVANGGWCVARHEGRVVFVRHTLPGERVRARITQETKNFLRADAVEILEASPDRVPAPCPFSGPGRCGGCDWQHVSLAGAAPAEGRGGGGAAPPRRRHRARGRRRGGARSPGRPRLAHPRAVRGTPRRRRRAAAPPLPHDRADRRVPDRPPSGRGAGHRAQALAGRAGVEAIASAGTGDRLAILKTRRPRRAGSPRGSGPARPVKRPVSGRPVNKPAGSSARTSPTAVAGQRQRILAGPSRRRPLSRRRCRGPGAPRARCGRPVLRRGPVRGRARRGHRPGRPGRRDRVGRPGGAATHGSTCATCRTSRWSGRGRDRPGRDPVRPRQDELNRADLVVLDPPRTGAGRDVVKRVAELAGRRIAYVSCDPATLARDLAFFSEQGWALSGFRAFDAFPMTQHVELLATLIKG